MTTIRARDAVRAGRIRDRCVDAMSATRSTSPRSSAATLVSPRPGNRASIRSCSRVTVSATGPGWSVCGTSARSRPHLSPAFRGQFLTSIGLVSKMTRAPGCCGCSRCCRRTATGLAPSWRRLEVSPRTLRATSSGCASSATPSTRSAVWPAATSSRLAPPCLPCCSTTTRRSRSRSGCGRGRRRGGRDRGDVGPGAHQAIALMPPGFVAGWTRSAQTVGVSCAAGRSIDAGASPSSRRPAATTNCSVRLPRRARQRVPHRGSSRTAWSRSAGAGTSSPTTGIATTGGTSGRPDHRAGGDRPAVPSRELPAEDAPAFVSAGIRPPAALRRTHPPRAARRRGQGLPRSLGDRGAGRRRGVPDRDADRHARLADDGARPPRLRLHGRTVRPSCSTWSPPPRPGSRAPRQMRSDSLSKACPQPASAPPAPDSGRGPCAARAGCRRPRVGPPPRA